MKTVIFAANQESRRKGPHRGEKETFYVAVTRARQKLTFINNWLSEPSPYLAGMGLQ